MLYYVVFGRQGPAKTTDCTVYRQGMGNLLLSRYIFQHSTSTMADKEQLTTILHRPDVRIFTSNDVTIYDSTGTTVSLASFFKPNETLAIVLIRHWGCTACQTFVRKLSNEASLDQLQAQQARIIIIGHGDPKLIPVYKGMLSTIIGIDAKRSACTGARVHYIGASLL